MNTNVIYEEGKANPKVVPDVVNPINMKPTNSSGIHIKIKMSFIFMKHLEMFFL